MSNGNVFESLFKVQSAINKMVVDGTRNPDQVLRYVQRVIDDPGFIAVLDPAGHPYRHASNGSTAVRKVEVVDWIEECRRFHQEVFGIEVDLSGIQIPAEQPGFGWLIIMTGGLTLNQIWAKCQERFNAYSYLGDDLDKAVPKHDRDPGKAYAIRVRDRVEADEENKNLSANALAKCKIQGMTLPERLKLELEYHWKTGEHLDIKTVTLCPGSRDRDGGVPSVDWRGDGLRVSNYHPGNFDGSIRARSAV